MSIQHLQSGYKFPPESLVITEDQGMAYAQAVGDSSASPSQQVPPMSVIAAGLSRFIQHLGLADGTVEVVHASQQVMFYRPITPGEPLEIQATLKSNNERKGSWFATVEMEFLDHAGSQVAGSSSLIVVNPS